MPFTFEADPTVPDALHIRPKVFQDERGWFMESHKRSDFEAAGLPRFVQDNTSFSSRAGTLRGLHLQVDPAAQGKLVSCSRGSIVDVAVDLRPGSATYGRHARAVLDDQEHAMLWVPPGFAHGFQTLQDDCQVAYKCSAEYSPAHERTVRWDDPTLAIEWPLQPVLNDRDAQAPLLQEVFG